MPNQNYYKKFKDINLDYDLHDNLSNPIKYLDNDKVLLYAFYKKDLKTIIIDKKSLPIISKGYAWVIVKHSLSDNLFYAVMYNYKLDKMLSMHRVLLNAKKGEIIDHADRNGLNNCLNNIKIVTHSENMLNKKRYKNSKTNITGVYIKNGKFSIAIQRDIKIIDEPKLKKLINKIHRLITEYDTQ